MEQIRREVTIKKGNENWKIKKSRVSNMMARKKKDEMTSELYTFKRKVAGETYFVDIKSADRRF